MRGPGLAEHLEPRTLLSTVEWDGGGGTPLWSNPLNWDGDAVPAAGDSVVIAGEGMGVLYNAPGTLVLGSLAVEHDLMLLSGTIVVSEEARVMAGDLTIAGATLRVNGELQVKEAGAVFLTAGRLDGAGEAYVETTVTWSGGVLGGPGVFRVAAQGTLDITAYNAKLERVLANEGTVNWTGRTLHIASGMIVNDDTGEFAIAQGPGTAFGATLSASDAMTRFVNKGLVNVSLPTGSMAGAEIKARVAFKQGSSLRLEQGIVALTGGGAFAGQVQGLGAARALLSGSGVFADGMTLQGAGSGGCPSMPQLPIQITGGVYTVQTGDSLGGLRISGGTVFLAEDVSVGVLELDGGVVKGAGNLTVTGSLEWTGGAILGSGALTIAQGAAMEVEQGMSTEPPLKILRNTAVAGALHITNAAVKLLNSKVHVAPTGALGFMEEVRLIGVGVGAAITNKGEVHVDCAEVVLGNVRITNDAEISVTGSTFEVHAAGAAVKNNADIELGMNARFIVKGNLINSGTSCLGLTWTPATNEQNIGRVIVGGLASRFGMIAVNGTSGVCQPPPVIPPQGIQLNVVWASQLVGDGNGVVVEGFAPSPNTFKLAHSLHLTRLTVGPA